MARMPVPWWARAATRFHLAHVVRFLRRDTKYIPSVQRPTDDEGLRMLVLAQLAKRHGFELRRMPRRRSVLIQDLAFNAILAAANRSLDRDRRRTRHRVATGAAGSFARTTAALEELWDDDTGEYYSRNAVSGALLCTATIATFLPLFAGVPQGRPRPPADRAASRRPTGPGRASRCRRSPPTRPSSTTRLLEGPDLGQHELDDHRRARRARRARPRRSAPRTLTGAGRGRGCTSTSRRSPATATAPPDFSWTAALTLELLAPPTRTNRRQQRGLYPVC